MQRSRIATAVLSGLASSLLLAGCTRKEPAEAAAPAATQAAAPSETVSADYPTHVYFGDTHLHTGLSLDAGAAGARLLPADAYRFAKGEEVAAGCPIFFTSIPQRLAGLEHVRDALLGLGHLRQLDEVLSFQLQ